MKNVEKRENGITLVALVVTIVVLLILAGITITYVFGDNGVFGQASDAKVKTEIAKIEERAQMIYNRKSKYCRKFYRRDNCGTKTNYFS